jgi:hypothetical protein
VTIAQLSSALLLDTVLGTYVMEGGAFVWIDAMLMKIDTFSDYASKQELNLISSTPVHPEGFAVYTRSHLRRLRLVMGVDSSMRFSRLSGSEVKANNASRNARDAMIGIACHDLVADGERPASCSMR